MKKNKYMLEQAAQPGDNTKNNIATTRIDNENEYWIGWGGDEQHCHRLGRAKTLTRKPDYEEN